MAPRAASKLPAGYKEDASKGPMLRFEESLPRLPVPSLEETAKRYLKSLHPLLSESEFEQSTKAVQEFLQPGGQGEALQSRLLAKRENTKNWIIDWWNDAAYLGYRDPVIPYVSYFYSYRDDRKRRDPAKRAAAISTAVLAFKKQVDEGTLEPEYMRKLPIAMSSYQYMFNYSRIPTKPVDGGKKYDYKKNAHIVVIRKNQFFKVLHEVDGKQLNTAELEAQLRRVYKKAERSAPIGVLTSENRDKWADDRERLIAASSTNLASLEMIESASFVICLDDASPITLEERAHQYWHGDGSNRWFDKPLQFIINDNGTAGFLGEHSMMDGTPTNRLNDTILMQLSTNALDFDATNVRSNLPEPQPIRFTVNKEVQADLDAARQHFDGQFAAHELRVQAYQGYGKGLIKKFKASPDAYVQMIMQLAYHKMFNKSRPTYESIATRRFQMGRTEAARTVSDESVAFCEAMANPNVDAKQCVTLLRKALDAHVKYVGDASDGRGVDRHLFGLKKCLKEGEKVPAVFEDPAFSYSGSWHLSTSQLSSEYLNGWGYSQVIDDGFGLAYMINEHSIQFNVVCKGLGAERMSFYLNEAAGDMRDILLPSLDKPAAKL
ncbi:carnitine O-acetyltransferas-like protein [Microthyrium microscopicum]|uniref:Carnitine O-acetyltransferase, mitochondrial n=1 Tax=Microthyrium microscopicum TaxID=703497 RepID=A0A6A6U9B4_9PEZI|nr:carnitine O-acetyltransferas-like protein [Microthyrium microscopicum]